MLKIAGNKRRQAGRQAEKTMLLFESAMVHISFRLSQDEPVPLPPPPQRGKPVAPQPKRKPRQREAGVDVLEDAGPYVGIQPRIDPQK